MGTFCFKTEHFVSKRNILFQMGTSGTKETESERESFPQTPFIEKGKGKENLTSSRCDEG
jgi:hypothetical protein